MGRGGGMAVGGGSPLNLWNYFLNLGKATCVEFSIHKWKVWKVENLISIFNPFPGVGERTGAENQLSKKCPLINFWPLKNPDPSSRFLETRERWRSYAMRLVSQSISQSVQSVVRYLKTGSKDFSDLLYEVRELIKVGNQGNPLFRNKRSIFLFISPFK